MTAWPQPHLVEQAEHMVLVHQVSHHLHWGPGAALEEALAQLGKGHLVHGEHLTDVALPAEAMQGR